jgi:hypothetical protein
VKLFFVLPSASYSIDWGSKSTVRSTPWGNCHFWSNAFKASRSGPGLGHFIKTWYRYFPLNLKKGAGYGPRTSTWSRFPNRLTASAAASAALLSKAERKVINPNREKGGN